MLDEFQTDVFVAMLEEDGGSLGRTFTGFTFFADHLGAFPSTSLSVPAMLTGKEFRNEQPVPEFVRQAFSETARDRTITWVKTLGRRQWEAGVRVPSSGPGGEHVLPRHVHHRRWSSRP